jgi:hypothetical protein
MGTQKRIHVCVVGKKWKKVKKKLYAWVMGIQRGDKKRKNSRGRPRRKGLELMGAQRWQGWWPVKGSVRGSKWPSRESDYGIL